MNTTKLSITTIFVAILIFSININTFAQAGKCEGGNIEEKVQGCEKIPGLSDKQKADIKKLRLNSQQQMLPIRNKINEKKAHLKTLQTAKNADMNAINSVIEEIGALKTQLHKIRVVQHQEIRKLLNKEQLLAFDTRGSKHKKCNADGRRNTKGKCCKKGKNSPKRKCNSKGKCEK